jgi:hypothetical protein
MGTSSEYNTVPPFNHCHKKPEVRNQDGGRNDVMIPMSVYTTALANRGTTEK